MSKSDTTDLPRVDSMVRMKSSGKRSYGGLARVVRRQTVGSKRKRIGIVVEINGREVWVNPGEVEVVDGR